MKAKGEYSLVFIAIVLLAVVLRELQSFLRPFAIALLLTFIMIPVFRWSKKKKIPSFAVIFGILVLFGIIFSVAGGLIAVEIEQFNSEDPTKQISGGLKILSQINQRINIDMEQVLDPEKAASIIAGIIKYSFSAIASILSELLIALIFLIFLLPSHSRILKNIEKAMDDSTVKKFRKGLLETEESIKHYLTTKSVISIGTAVASGIMLLVFNANFIVTLSILIFILNFIPNIGSFLAVFIALVTFILKAGFGWQFIVLAALLILIQLVFGNIVEPKYAGNKLKLSPIIIIMSLFLWYWIWGVVGMILAIPITSVIKIILKHSKGTRFLAELIS